MLGKELQTAPTAARYAWSWASASLGAVLGVAMRDADGRGVVPASGAMGLKKNAVAPIASTPTTAAAARRVVMVIVENLRRI
jgi:hypothetical protein